MIDEIGIMEIINSWPEERRTTYINPQDTEQLIHCKMRVRLKHEEKNGVGQTGNQNAGQRVA